MQTSILNWFRAYTYFMQIYFQNRNIYCSTIPGTAPQDLLFKTLFSSYIFYP